VQAGKTMGDFNLVWMDLEMTGLNPDRDSILEMATIITDAELNERAVGPVFAIHHPVPVLESMDDWNRRQHSQSGLWQRVLDSTTSMAEAEAQTLAFVRGYVGARQSPLCGNSICQDRRFLFKHMPALEQYLHYRNVDVSTLKELARRWAPQVVDGFKKTGAHLALADIRESINELKHYRRFMGVLGGTASG